MKLNLMKWALPAFAVTALLAGDAAAGIPGKTSYGARLGYNNMSLNGNAITEAADFNAGNPVPQKKFDKNYGAATGSLFISHDVDVHRNLCLGLEGYVGGSNMDTGRISHVVDEGTEPSTAMTTVRKDYTAGLRLKLGHHIKNDVMAYLSFGGEVSRFKIDHVTHLDGVNIGFNSGTGISKNKTLYAWVPGVGVKWKLKGNWCCNIDATYAMYDSYSEEVSKTPANYRYQLGFRPTVFGLTVGFSRPF